VCEEEGRIIKQTMMGWMTDPVELSWPSRATMDLAQRRMLKDYYVGGWRNRHQSHACWNVIRLPGQWESKERTTRHETKGVGP
jgi:hypothetical protein